MKFKPIFFILILASAALFFISQPGRVSTPIQVIAAVSVVLLLIESKDPVAAGIVSGLLWSVDIGLIAIILIPLVTLMGLEKKIKPLIYFAGSLVATRLALIPLSFFLFIPFGETPVSRTIIDGSMFAFPGILFLLAALPGVLLQWHKERERTIQLLILLAVLIFPPAAQHPFTVAYTLLFYLLTSYWAAMTLEELVNKLDARFKERKLNYGVIALLAALLVVWPLLHVTAQRNANLDNRVRALSWIDKNIETGSTIIVPSQLEMKTETLQHNHHTIFMNFEEFNGETLNMIAALSESSWLLSPDWLQYGEEPELKRCFTFWNEAVNRTGEKTAFPGSPLLSNYYYPLPTRNPAISIRRLGKPDTSTTLLHPWHPLRNDPQKTSPALHSLGIRGTFPLNFRKENNRNVLQVTFDAPGKEGKKVCQLGFTANKKGITIPLQAGNTVYLAVDLEFPAEVVRKNNYLFIQDFNGTWERSKHFVPQVKGPVTLTVSKRIRNGCTRLNLGVMFQPRKRGDQLKIRDIKIVVKQVKTEEKVMAEPST